MSIPFTISILLGTVLANMVVAISNTFNKEKQMVKEGGNPLPTSSYVFLVVKYLLWAGCVALFIPFKVYYPTTYAEWTLFSAGIVIVAYLAATILEVLIRVILVYGVTARRKMKENKNRVDE